MLIAAVLADTKRFMMYEARTDYDDEYLTTRIPLDSVFGSLDEEVYIDKITAITDGKVHHLIIKGCSDEVKEVKPANSTFLSECVNHTIIFSWAQNAGPLVLPEDAAIRVGGISGIKTINVEAHYTDKFDGADNFNGIQVEISRKAPKKLIGIFFLGSNFFLLPPGKETNVNVECDYPDKEPIDIFAFRTHAHSHGKVITGYRYRQSEGYHMIGKGNPQWPHAFYTRVGGPIRVQKGDTVHATCTFFNEEEKTVQVGPGRTDEMCNLYLMYSVPYAPGPLHSHTCWGTNFLTDPEIPDDLTDMTPYPGFAGEDSIKAIQNGWNIPPVPTEMVMHHHGNDHHEDHDHGMMDDDDDKDEMNDLKELKTQLNHLQNIPKSASLLAVTPDSGWRAEADLGEVAGVDTDYDGTLWIFHRGEYTWGDETFDIYTNIVTYKKPTTASCVIQVDAKTGKVIQKWGDNMFYLPHGITVTRNGIWLTDVGTHMIYHFSKDGTLLHQIGVDKVPGKSNYQFCKPTDVAVDESTGEFFVGDGYCNSRIVHYSNDRKYLDEFGNTNGKKAGSFLVVHDIAIGPGGDLFVSDREHGRIQVFDRDTKTIVKIYKSDTIGDAIYASVWSPQVATLFLVNNWSEISRKQQKGFSLEANGTIKGSFTPEGGMGTAHDIALSKDGKCIFIAELRPHVVHMFHVETAENEVSNYRSSSSKIIMGVVHEKPMALTGTFIIIAIVVILVTAIIVRKRIKKKTRTFVYRPLLTNEGSDDEEVSLFDRKTVA